MKDTLLYVEDNDDNARLVERILKQRPNVDLITAANGHQGLQSAQTAIPSLILLDRRLPDMLGNEFLRHLKAAPRTATIPVVMVSSDSAREQSAEALQLGADEYLPKPYDVSQLLRIIDRFCFQSLSENQFKEQHQ